MSNPKQIWLAPDCDGECDRELCQDDVLSACDDCGSESVKYVLASDYDQLAAENATLHAQVAILQSAENSWQSGYDKGRRDGTKHRQSEAGQIAADNKRLKGGADADAAEIDRLQQEYDKAWRRAGMAEENVSVIAADNNQLREALKDVHYHVESARVWNGMGWTFTGVHPSRQETIIGKIDDALSGYPK